jgi:molybdopterin synthase sulfur carrier subunit
MIVFLIMSIQVKLFAGLAERVGRREAVLDHEPGLTVADVWDRIAGERARPGNLLSAVNMEYAPIDQMVNDGDEVAFFPPVTGG